MEKKKSKRIKLISLLLAGVIVIGAGIFILSWVFKKYPISIDLSQYDVTISCDKREGTVEEFRQDGVSLTITFTNNTGKTLRYAREKKTDIFAGFNFYVRGIADGYVYHVTCQADDDNVCATLGEDGYYQLNNSIAYNFPGRVKKGESITLQYRLAFSEATYWTYQSDDYAMPDILVLDTTEVSYNTDYSLGGDDSYKKLFSTSETLKNYVAEGYDFAAGYYSLYLPGVDTVYANFFHIAESTETTNS